MKKILIISDIDTSNENKAGNVNAFNNLIDLLKKDTEVCLRYLNFNRKISSHKDAINSGLISLAIAVERKIRNINGRKKLLNHKKSSVSKLWAKYVINRYRPDFIIVEYLELSYLLEIKAKIKIHCRWIIDLHDLMAIRYQSFLSQGLNPKEKMNISLSDEIEFIKKFDLSLILQHKEKTVLQKSGVKNVFLTPRFGNITSTKNTLNKYGDFNFGFIGANNEPNVKSVRYIMDNILVEMKQKIIIAGEICEKIKSLSDELLVIAGPVDELKDFYKKINVLINPSFGGTGLKTKNIESLMHLTPVITNQEGAVGMEKLVGKVLFIANNKEEWKDRTDYVYVNYFEIMKNIENVVRDFIGEQYDWGEFQKYIHQPLTGN